MAEGIADYCLTPHSPFEKSRRGISGNVVASVVTAPEQRQLVRPGRVVLQSKITFGGRTYLVRVIVDIDRSPAEVVTVYRTSNVAKYCRNEP